MKFILVVVATFLIGANAQAQLRKCTGPDGKVTYSDVLCSNTSSTSSIRNPDGNTLDTSGFRKQVQKMQTVQDEADANERLSAARQKNTPQECKFAYFSLGDEKGKKLAANAKEECLRNNEAKKVGEATSLEHYNFWNDHRNQKSADRQAAVTRANADANAQATRNAIDRATTTIENRRYTCKPSYSGKELDCK